MASRHPDRKACINQFAVIDLILCGPPNRVKAVFTQTRRTLKRLRVRTKDVQPFTKTPRGGVGDYANLHEVMFWLNDIQKTEQYKDDIEFLRKIHVTAKARVDQIDSVV